MSPPSPLSVAAPLLGLAVLGAGILFWLASVSAEEMTPARVTLLNIADGMTMISLGALLGFAVGRIANRSNGRPS